MNNLQKRKHLIRKLFKVVAKETVGPENLNKVKLLILTKYHINSSFCSGSIMGITIGLNLSATEQRIKKGYTAEYYKDRLKRINKYIINNRHNALRFVLYHELRHAYQRLNNNERYNNNKYQREYDADSWALAHLKTRKTDQTVRPKIKVVEYIDLYKSGLSTTKIALLCKVKDPRSVRYYLTKAGISLRRNSE